MERIRNQMNYYIKDHIDWSIVKQFAYKNKLEVTAALVTLYGLWFIKRPRNLPPGPYGYPFIGSLTTIFGDFTENLNELGNKYGDVFTLWFGSNNYYVILNSFDVIKEAYVTRGEWFSDRPFGKAAPGLEINETLFHIPYNDTYKHSRKVGTIALRNGIIKKLDLVMERELARLNEYVLGQDIDICEPTLNVFTNIILELLFRKNYPHNHKEIINLSEAVQTSFSGLSSAGFINFLPNIFLPVLKGKVEKSKLSVDGLMRITEEFVKECKINPPDKRDVISVADAYLHDTSPKITTEQVAPTLLLYLSDGIHTSVYMCQWIFAYLLNYPMYQENIWKEIQDLKGDKAVCIADRQKMPITESFIMEVFRIVTPFPIGAFVHPRKDVVFRGYNIPSSVCMLPHFEAVHFDPKLFPEPHQFKPERFIAKGKISQTEAFMPFGIGRRMCVGESLVRNNMFLYMTRMIQKYKIRPSKDGPPSLDKDKSGLVIKCVPFKIRLEERV